MLGVKPTDLPGYDELGTIVINYRFPDGIQWVSIKGVSAGVEPTDLPGYDGCSTLSSAIGFLMEYNG